MLKAILIMLLIAIVALVVVTVVIWRETMKMDSETSEFCLIHDEAEPCPVCHKSSLLKKGGQP